MAPRTVLVVDDDAPTRRAYAEFLQACGYEVVEAAHGGEAILHVYRHRPDVVLMDISMPVLDGVETAESLRAYSRDLRILAVTGSESALQKERMRALCDGLLTKPCAPEVVASRIRSLMDMAA
jgi:CheY-like chemotaxis protein